MKVSQGKREKGVTIKLTKDEAFFLLKLFRNIGGSPCANDSGYFRELHIADASFTREETYATRTLTDKLCGAMSAFVSHFRG